MPLHLPKALKALDPETFVAALNEEGCDITLEQYQAFLVALTKIGVRKLSKEVTPVFRGETFPTRLERFEELIDASEPIKRKLLRLTLDHHLNHHYATQPTQTDQVAERAR